MAVLTTNTNHYPNTANAWDSLADAFFHSGDVPKAVDHYQKALAIDNWYSNADFATKFVSEHPQK